MSTVAIAITEVLKEQGITRIMRLALASASVVVCGWCI